MFKSIFVLAISFIFYAPLSMADEDISGKAVFDKWCVICHGKSNAYPATSIISMRMGSISKAALENRTDLTQEYVKHIVRNGFNWMPTFRKTEIDDKSLEALSKYLAN